MSRQTTITVVYNDARNMACECVSIIGAIKKDKNIYEFFRRKNKATIKSMGMEGIAVPDTMKQKRDRWAIALSILSIIIALVSVAASLKTYVYNKRLNKSYFAI